MWTAAAGAAAQSQNLDMIANNLANSDTPAFKKDLPTFKEYLATTEREHPPGDIPRGQIKDKDLYPLDGRDQAYVVLDGSHTSYRQGHLRVTQDPLDLAMDGPGFLEVNTPAGVRYTRHGSLKIATDGKLVTSEGYPVLATAPNGLAAGLSEKTQKPADVASRYVNLKDKGVHFSIGTQGELYAGDELVGKLSVVEFKDMNQLVKKGAQYFVNPNQENKTLPSHTQVRQGVLETSNVNPIEEMTGMIRANRLFEEDLKALKTYGELLGKEANDIGKL